MAATLILWSHAFAALMFGAMGIASFRGTDRGWPRVPFCAAALLTALWALGVAGIDPRDVGTRLVEAARNLAWLWFAAALARREGAHGRAVTALTLVTGGVVVAGAALTPALNAPLAREALAAIATARLVLRVIAALGALVLLCHLAQAARRDGRWLALAIGGVWGIDLVAAATAIVTGDLPDMLVAARGLILLGVGAMIGAAAQGRGDAGPSISRGASLRLVGGVAIAGYVAVTIWAVDAAATFFAGEVRAVQTAIILGASAALVTLAATPWLRAWVRVKLAKHLFPHRYDYRLEWQRFSTTLSAGRDGEPLGQRLVRALADLTDAPAGLLLCYEQASLVLGAEWGWRRPNGAVGAGAFVDVLTAGRIVSLDEERQASTSGVPAWLLEDGDAWIVVPLLHDAALVGAIALTRPPIDRALDWEDLDLLRVVGRQAASYLAEDRAHAALAEAARFDEFHRRFAFVLHDIKNVASQLSLVARNAERHAANPAFRADMIDTLRDGAGRLGTLLARLGGQEAAPAEAIQPVDVEALALRLATRTERRIAVTATAAIALAAPARLEQALAHIVQNAAEAGGDEDVHLVVTGDGRVAIEVIDRGCGMSADFVRDRLFRPFASTKAGGFGIGAYEARQLVLGMGGTIDVESREGEGTRFRIVLPAAPAWQAAA